MTADDIAEAARTWREEGWVLIPGLVPAAEIDAALPDLWTTFPDAAAFHGDAPDPRREAFFAYRDPATAFWPAAPRGPAFRPDQLLGLRPFPFAGGGALNRLMVHPNLLAFARQALGQDAVALYQAMVWAKYAGVTDYEQPMHRDNNHSLLPPAPGAEHIEGFLYLSDVDEGSAPTRLVPRSAATAPPGCPAVQPGRSSTLQTGMMVDTFVGSSGASRSRWRSGAKRRKVPWRSITPRSTLQKRTM